MNAKEIWCFIDGENFPKAIPYALTKNYKRVFVFLGACQRKIDVSLSGAVFLEVIKVENTAPNNLDFHLSYYLGKYDTSAGPHVEFLVFSNDKGYDGVIHFIRQSGRRCKRMRYVSPPKPKRAVKVPTEEAILSDLEKVIKQLKKQSVNRPAKVSSLINFVKATIRNIETARTPEQIIEILRQENLIQVNGHNKVEYPSF